MGAGDLKDIQRYLKLVDAQEKLLRLIEGRRQAAGAKLDWRKTSRADLSAMLAEFLEALAPGARERIRRIAAGELGP